MNPLFKYSLSLSILFFSCMIIPGLICIICGFNVIWASIGISLAIVCFSKGHIARNIFGENTTHHSSPVAGTILIAISLISAAIKIFLLTDQNAPIESLNDNSFITREVVFNKYFVPVLIASAFWAIILGIITFIRGRKRHHIISSEKNYINTSNGVTSGIVSNCNKKNSYTATKTYKGTSKTTDLRIGIRTFVFTILSLILINIILFLLFLKPNEDNVLSEYLYRDRFGFIHLNPKCNSCSDVCPTRILYSDFVPKDESLYCKYCINDIDYQRILNDNKINKQIYDIYLYMESNFDKKYYKWMFKDSEQLLNYIKNGNIWDLHRIYILKIKKSDNRTFKNFKEFLSYCGRKDLIKELSFFYTNMTEEERDIYIKLYRKFIPRYSYEAMGCYYTIEEEKEFNYIAKNSSERREFVYDLLKDYMNLGNYKDYEKTIIQ